MPYRVGGMFVVLWTAKAESGGMQVHLCGRD
jgi:hypothetical protein